MLKLDPKNTELLAQKQKLLGDEIAVTSKKLEELKLHQKEITSSGQTLTAEQQKQYRNLQREIIATEQTLQNLKLEASNWNKASQALDSYGQKMQALGSKVSDLGNKFMKLTAVIGAGGVFGIKANADIERYSKAFETFLGSAEEADKAIKQIKSDSKTSIFDTADLIQANQMLITTGEEAGESRKTINALGDAIALTGGNSDTLSRMAQNLQQIKNVGKASAMDIKQFGMAGIDIYGILAEYTGKTTEELKKMDITYEDVTKALQQSASEGGKYYKGQIQMADTLTGQISKLKKTFTDLLGELTKAFYPEIQDGVNKLQKLAEKFSNLDDNTKKIIGKIALLVAGIGPLLKILGPILTLGGKFVSLIGTSIIPLIAKLVGGTAQLGPVMTALTGPIGAVIAIVGALVGAFVLLWNNSETFRGSMTELGNKLVEIFEKDIKPTIDNVKEILMKLWNDVLLPLVDFIAYNVGPIIEKIFIGVGNVIVTAFSKVATIVKTVTGVLSGLIDFVVGVFTGDWSKAWEGVIKIFGNIFEGIKELFKVPINWIIDRINDFLGELRNIRIPDWVLRCRRKRYRYS